jgi:hypothetical protein
MPRFDWVRDVKRKDLADVRAALRGGQLDAPSRLELLAVVQEVCRAEGLTCSAATGVVRCGR